MTTISTVTSSWQCGSPSRTGRCRASWTWYRCSCWATTWGSSWAETSTAPRPSPGQSVTSPWRSLKKWRRDGSRKNRFVCTISIFGWSAFLQSPSWNIWWNILLCCFNCDRIEASLPPIFFFKIRPRFEIPVERKCPNLFLLYISRSPLKMDVVVHHMPWFHFICSFLFFLIVTFCYFGLKRSLGVVLISDLKMFAMHHGKQNAFGSWKVQRTVFNFSVFSVWRKTIGAKDWETVIFKIYFIKHKNYAFCYHNDRPNSNEFMHQFIYT